MQNTYHAGMQAFDRAFPGWRNEVDANTLDETSGIGFAILARVAGSIPDGMHRLERVLGEKPDLTALGFYDDAWIV